MTDTKKSNAIKVFRIARIIALIAAPILLAVRTLDLFLFFEPSIGYYKQGAVLPTVFTVACYAIVIAAFICAAVFFKKDAPKVQATSISARCAAVFVALALAAYAVHAVLSPYEWLEFFNAKELSSIAFHIITVLNILAPVAGCLYFVLFATQRLAPSSAITGGLGVIIFSVLILAFWYFDITVQMNAPEKLAAHICSISAMLLIYSEMRLACGEVQKPFYYFSLIVGATMLPAMSLSTVIASFAGALGTSVTAPSASSLVFSALGIFAIVRLIMTDTYATDDDEILSLEEPDTEEAETPDTNEITEQTDAENGGQTRTEL